MPASCGPSDAETPLKYAANEINRADRWFFGFAKLWRT
jgi:hypothetical protein